MTDREAIRAACDELRKYVAWWNPDRSNPSWIANAAIVLDALDAAEQRVKALEGALTPFVGEHECDGHATVERFDMAVAVSVRWSDVIQGRAALNTGEGEDGRSWSIGCADTYRAEDNEMTTQARKYTVAEIDDMRRSIASSYPSGVSYCADDRAADVERRLQTHMANGTDPGELSTAASERRDREYAAQEAYQERHAKMIASRPAPKPILTKADVMEQWFADCVAKYGGTTTTARDLYDGFSGRTLKQFANHHAPDGVNITQGDMERFLDGKGIRSRRAMFDKRYDGVAVVIYGSVSSGNYGT